MIVQPEAVPPPVEPLTFFSVALRDDSVEVGRRQ